MQSADNEEKGKRLCRYLITIERFYHTKERTKNAFQECISEKWEKRRKNINKMEDGFFSRIYFCEIWKFGEEERAMRPATREQPKPDRKWSQESFFVVRKVFVVFSSLWQKEERTKCVCHHHPCEGTNECAISEKWKSCGHTVQWQFHLSPSP